MENLCRLCLKQFRNIGEAHNLFSACRNGDTIADKIVLICPLLLDENDITRLPSRICHDCFNLIESACELRESSIRNDIYLRSQLEEPLSVHFSGIKEEKMEESVVFKVEAVGDDSYYDANDAIVYDDGESDDYGNNEEIEEEIKNAVKPEDKFINSATYCELCNMQLSSSSSLKRHQRRKHKEKYPVRKLLENKRYRRGDEELFKEERYPCNYCPKHFKSEYIQKRHTQIFHRDEYLAQVAKKKLSSHTIRVGCSLCFKQFTNSSMMKTHLKTVHAVDYLNYYCDYCEFSTESKRMIENHIKTKHLKIDQRVNQCHVCPKAFIHPRTLRNHLATAHKVIAEDCHVCDLCGYFSQLKNHLKAHIMRQHLCVLTDLTCEVCKQSFDQKKALELHRFCHEDIVEELDPKTQKLTCTLCTVEFYEEKELLKHLYSHQDDIEAGVTACNLCYEIITNFDQIMEHTKQNHLVKLSHRCLQCKKVFYYGHRLLTHVRDHKQRTTPQHLCIECGRSFHTMNAINKHIKITHQKFFTCPHCKKVYNTKYAYEHHVSAEHTNVWKFKCEICDKVFTRERKYKSHYAYHLNKNRNQCTICSATFESAYGLKTHMSRHDGTLVKKFKCTQCLKLFRSNWHLNEHIRTHTKEKPYACEYCNKTYARKGDWNTHLRTHIGENTYRCEHKGCKEAFKFLEQLKAHKMTHASI